MRHVDGGRLEWEQLAGRRRAGVSPQVAYLISDILSDDAARMPAFGAGGPLQLSRPAAAKTGTTTDFRDNWTLGYTPQLAVGVWVGNADNEPMVRTSGVTGAAPIWHDFMEAALAGQPVLAVHAAGWDRGGRDLRELRPPGHRRTARESAPRCSSPAPSRWQSTTPTAACTIDSATGLLWADGCAGPPVQTGLSRGRAGDRGVGAQAGHRLTCPPASATGRPSRPRGRAAPLRRGPVLLVSYPDADAVLALSSQIPAERQQIELSAWASPGILRLRMEMDGAALRTFDGPPYRVLWPLSTGTHTLSIVGWDAAGRAYEGAPVTFRVEQAEIANRR